MKRASVAVAVVASVLGTSGSASAVEREHHIGVAPQLTMLDVADKSTLSVGGGIGAHYTYGLTDQLLLMGELAFAIVAANQKQDTPTTPHTRPSEVDHLSGGIGYVLDILRFVPYGGALVGGYRLAGGTLDSALILPGAQLQLGLDYLLSRHFAIGVAGQQHFLFTKMSTYPSLTMVLLRAEYVWGF
jgi:hypothetical protein